MCERWESSCTQSIELVLEEHDLLLLGLDNIHQLTLVGDLLASGFGVLLGVVSSGLASLVRRFELNDLLALVDVQSEVTGLSIELFILGLLLSDLALKLLLCFINGLDSLCGILVKLLDLSLKSLFILLILLLVLSLDDLLRLLCYTIQLHILGTLLKVDDLELQPLVLVLNSL